MNKVIGELTDAQLRERAKSLATTLARLRAHGSKEDVEEVKADLDLIHEEREKRYLGMHDQSDDLGIID